MHESGICLLNKELHNMYIHCRISPRRTCTLCGFTMKISSRGQRHFIYNVKRNTKRDGMGPFNEATKASIYLLGRYKKNIQLLLLQKFTLPKSARSEESSLRSTYVYVSFRFLSVLNNGNYFPLTSII